MKNVLLSIAVLSLVTSCYKDKGNYDYHLNEMNEIKTISFIPATINTISGKTIELQQPLNDEQTTGHIEVKLEQTLASNIDNLDFYWYISHKEGEKDIKDTLRSKGYIDVPLAIGKETKYDVLLEIKDNTTTLSKFDKLTIQTRPIFKNSLFVLHGENGRAQIGNIETVGSETKVRTNAYATIHPESTDNPYKNASGLVYAVYLNGLNPASRLGILFNDGSSQVYNPYGLEDVLWKNYALPLNTASGRPFTYKSHFTIGRSDTETDYHCILSTDGRFYWSRHKLAFKVPGASSNNPHHLKETEYNVSTGTMTNNYIVLWDQKKDRFICVSNQEDYYNFRDEEKAGDLNFQLFNPVLDAHVNFKALNNQGISPQGKEAIYAYISYKNYFEEAHPFFIFKDKNANNYYLYELTPLDNEKSTSKVSSYGNKSEENEPLFSITGKKLKDFQPNLGVYTTLYSTDYISNYLFYAEGGNLYRYNTSNADKSLIYQAPEGWNITLLKLRSYDTSNFMGEDDNNLRQYISIGMNKENEGAIAEIRLTTSGDIDDTFTTEVYTQDAEGQKFGKIIDLQFAYEYMYHIKEYK